MQKLHKKSASAHHRTMFLGYRYIFATKACIDNRKKLVKQQYLLQMLPQYGELQPTNCSDRLVSLEHPNKFQWILHQSRTTQPKLDRTDLVKSATSELAILYQSDTDSDLPWTVRKYTSISKRKCNTLHKWCAARNSAVSG